jgi:LacI family transcriptional regulator
MAKVTLKIIADSLKISKGLVSIALSDKYGVSEKTRSEIVIKAIQLGYDFNKIKKFRESQVGKVIYVLTKEVDLHVDRFWPEIIKGIEQQAHDINFKIRVKSWDDQTDFEKFISEVIDMKAIGIIIISELPPFVFNHLVGSKIPMVLVDGKAMYDDAIDTISVNNYAASFHATEYVIQKGHRHIAFVGDINHAYSFNQRFLGFLDAAKRYEGILTTHLISAGDDPTLTYSYSNRELRKYLLERNVEAYICANDNIAEKIYGIAKDYGLKIPRDISVVGFDDNFMSKNFDPSLTTIEVPKKEMGKVTLLALNDRIKNRQGSFKRVNLHGRIVERNSILDKRNPPSKLLRYKV